MKQLTIETEREVDGRWIAEVPELPGAMAYGSTRDEAIAQAEILALRVLAENIEEDGRPAVSRGATLGWTPRTRAGKG